LGLIGGVGKHWQPKWWKLVQFLGMKASFCSRAELPADHVLRTTSPHWSLNNDIIMQQSDYVGRHTSNDQTRVKRRLKNNKDTDNFVTVG
jgi:hypothetical protein